MPLSNYAKDKFVAPRLSKLTQCHVPDMSQHDSQCMDWITNYVLNTSLRVNVPQPQRAFHFMFLRRSETAFYEYDNARNCLDEYVKHKRLYRFIRAVHHFESFLSQAWQGYEILRRLLDRRVFEKGDGSPHERLHILHCKSKHSDSAIERGEVPGDTTMPIWLTNDGIECAEATLSYEEMSEVLVELASCAAQLSNPSVPGVSTGS